ncbi:MAG: hypothetical protein C0402_14095 [Thermodesulfovibrio sp.]|nr:hypothetical protein [Thermodesulfovibrio sp.]
MKMLKLQPILRLFGAALIMIVFLTSAGCSAKYKQAPSDLNLSSLGPLKIIRHETPGIMKSAGTETHLLALVTIAAPGGSALLVLGDAIGKARGTETQTVIPDFGTLVLDRMAEGIATSFPSASAVEVVREPLTEEFNGSSAVMELNVKRLAYGSIDLSRGGVVLDRGLDKGLIVDGFLSKTEVTLKDRQGEVLWQMSHLYLSKDFGRERPIDDLEADNCDLLRQEMQFAAVKTAEEFIRDLNGKKN